MPVSTVILMSLVMTLSVWLNPVEARASYGGCEYKGDGMKAEGRTKVTIEIVMIKSQRAEPPSQTVAQGKREEILVRSFMMAN
jgi:hypothetical protein